MYACTRSDSRHIFVHTISIQACLSPSLTYPWHTFIHIHSTYYHAPSHSTRTLYTPIHMLHILTHNTLGLSQTIHSVIHTYHMALTHVLHSFHKHTIPMLSNTHTAHTLSLCHICTHSLSYPHTSEQSPRELSPSGPNICLTFFVLEKLLVSTLLPQICTQSGMFCHHN